MSSRAEVSQKNQYWIGKHRYYELKHFCLQYYDWKRYLVILDQKTTHNLERGGNLAPDLLERLAIRRIYFQSRVNTLEKAIAKLDEPILSKYIFEGVTTGRSYYQMDVPCCRDIYYKLYRQFFWILDKE